MKWNRYRLSTTSEAEDIVAATLAECGVEGVEIVDKIPLTEEEKKQMFVDIAPETEADDGSAFLYFYLDPEEDTEGILARVRTELDALRPFCKIGSCAIDISETEDVDWINNWKQYFHQFTIDTIRIVPSWEEIEKADEEEMILHIDPGTAFGTGMHETTQLCVRRLKNVLKEGDRVLDVGTGSGILSIIAMKLGAGSALGTDLDPCAESAVKENCAANDTTMAFLLGNLIDDPAVQDAVGYEVYDVVLSNILADILVPLAPAVARCMKPGAHWITSGILQGQEQKVIDAAEAAGMTIADRSEQGEWVGLTFCKEG